MFNQVPRKGKLIKNVLEKLTESDQSYLCLSREEDFGNVKVKLDCSNTRISMPLLEDGKEGSFEGPFEKMIVPGHTTQVDFHRSGLTILKRELLEGSPRKHFVNFRILQNIYFHKIRLRFFYAILFPGS